MTALSKLSPAALPLTLLLFAAVGIAPLSNMACQDVWTWDPDRQEWVAVDPIAIQPAITEAADIAKATLAATGQATWIPIVDLVARAIALLLAFRYVKPTAPPTQPVSKENVQ